jgi:hypothetical protein
VTTRSADLLATARDIWQGTPPLGLEHGALVLAKIVGDLAGALRDRHEGVTWHSELDESRCWGTVYRELGNLLLTVPRLIEDAGLPLQECLELAEQAQRDYAARVRSS